MKLLDIVQNILSAMSLEEVNSIEDVPEALQIAEIVKETYYQIISHREWEFLNLTFSLEASGDLDKPNIMTIPSGIADISFLKYYDEKDSTYKTLQYLSPEAFLEANSNVILKDSVTQITGLAKQVDAIFRVQTDKQPEYFTSFDEKTIIFDSYNSNYDMTLQSNKTLCYGNKHPIFELNDDYEIEMPEEMVWSYLLPESKSVASVNILQTVNEKEEQRSRRGRWRMYYAHPKTSNGYKREVQRYGRK